MRMTKCSTERKLLKSQSDRKGLSRPACFSSSSLFPSVARTSCFYYTEVHISIIFFAPALALTHSLRPHFSASFCGHFSEISQLYVMVNASQIKQKKKVDESLYYAEPPRTHNKRAATAPSCANQDNKPCSES